MLRRYVDRSQPEHQEKKKIFIVSLTMFPSMELPNMQSGWTKNSPSKYVSSHFFRNFYYWLPIRSYPFLQILCFSPFRAWKAGHWSTCPVHDCVTLLLGIILTHPNHLETVLFACSEFTPSTVPHNPKLKTLSLLPTHNLFLFSRTLNLNTILPALV